MQPSIGRRVQTSGTTGSPKPVRWSGAAMRWRDAAEERSREWAGVGGGASRVWICCNPADRLRRAALAAGNTAIFSANHDPARIADRLIARPPAVLQGVSNALAAVADEVSACGVRLDRTTVISAGNHLTPWYRRRIESAFGGPIHERYATVEAGLIASTCELRSMHVNTDLLGFELLGADGVPGAEGEIAVTMPAAGLAGYRPGDRGRLHADRCGCGRRLPVLAGVGRVEEFLPGSGEGLAEPAAVFAAVDSVAVRDARVIRSGHRTRLTLWLEPYADARAEAAAAGARLAHLLGEPPSKVEVGLAAEPLPLAPSGKARLITRAESAQ